MRRSTRRTGERPRLWGFSLIRVTYDRAAWVKRTLASTITFKLDGADRDRIASLATLKKRIPHYRMKEAILEYVKREDARQNIIAAAEASFEHYKETGLHISFDEFSTWVDEAQQGPGARVPACHTQGFQRGPNLTWPACRHFSPTSISTRPSGATPGRASSHQGYCQRLCAEADTSSSACAGRDLEL